MAPDTLSRFADSEQTASIGTLTDDSGLTSGVFTEHRGNIRIIRTAN